MILTRNASLLRLIDVYCLSLMTGGRRLILNKKTRSIGISYICIQCSRRNVKYFGRVFLMLNYTDITQNTYIQS